VELLSRAPAEAALYHRDGPFLVPSPLTAGPWSPDAQHGGPVAALFAHSIEAEPAADGRDLLRLSVELLRPVPLAPLTVRTEVVRTGRTVTLVDCFLTAGTTELARSRGLLLARRALELPPADPVAAPPLPGEDPRTPLGPPRTPFLDAVDLRFVRGEWDRPGPAGLWGRLRLAVVAGEAVSGMARVAALADFGNGVSRLVPFETHRFLNADLTVALARPPAGEWFYLDVATHLAATGSGQASAALADREGHLGRSLQTLVVSARADP